MRATLALIPVIIVASLGLASTARAQTNPKVRVSFNAGTQNASQTVTQNFGFKLYQEDASVATSIDLTGGTFFDVGGMFRVASNLWVGAALSMLSRTTGAGVASDLPHPFFFSRPRKADGTVQALESKEQGLHISMGYAIPVGNKLDVMVFGGPSQFTIKQDLVTEIKFSETYPFDTASLTSASTVNSSGKVWGFNAGADISVHLSKAFAVGGLIRFAKATTTLDAATGNVADIDAGGVMAGGGVRVIF